MKKGELKLMFWNVQNWGEETTTQEKEQRFDRVLATILHEDPDVAVIAEVCNSSIKTKLAETLPSGYSIFETTNKDKGRSDHTLIAIFKHAAGRSVTMQQRNEFMGPKNSLRSFPLLTVHEDNKRLAILGVHSKSGSYTKAYNRRKEILRDVANLASVLEAQNTPMVAMGDMNTMGDRQRNISSFSEIKRSNFLMYDPTRDRRYKNWRAGHLVSLWKDARFTWMGVDEDKVYPDISLDHVYVSKSLLPRCKSVDNKRNKVHVGDGPRSQQTKKKSNGSVITPIMPP